MLRIIIACDRKFNNKNNEILLAMEELTLDIDLDCIQILYSDERGAYSLGKKFAEEYNTSKAVFPTLRDRYGDHAASTRNKLMIDNADYLLVFINDNKKSGEAKNILDLSINSKLKVVIINYEQ